MYLQVYLVAISTSRQVSEQEAVFLSSQSGSVGKLPSTLVSAAVTAFVLGRRKCAETIWPQTSSCGLCWQLPCSVQMINRSLVSRVSRVESCPDGTWFSTQQER